MTIVVWKHENIIQVDIDEAIKEVPKHIIYQRLEDNQGIGKSKWCDRVNAPGEYRRWSSTCHNGIVDVSEKIVALCRRS